MAFLFRFPLPRLSQFPNAPHNKPDPPEQGDSYGREIADV
jgi:hypothetical protein